MINKLLIGAIVSALTYVAYTKTYPRGIRNNNPGNIEYNPGNEWTGQIGAEMIGGRFAAFETMPAGVRALSILLINYYERYGLQTVTAIINRWAPSVENETGSYIAHVSEKMGVNPFEVFELNETNLTNLTAAIIKQENGRMIADYDLTRGVEWALKDKGLV